MSSDYMPDYYGDEPPLDEQCDICGARQSQRCEHLVQLEREEREREADREAAWWRNVGGPLLGLPDEGGA